MNRERIENILNIVMMFVAALALFSLIGKGGLSEKISDKAFIIMDIVIISIFILSAIIRFILAPRKWEYLKSHPFQYILILLFASQILIVKLLLTDVKYRFLLNQLSIISVTQIYIILMQLYILIEIFAEIGRINSRLARLPIPASVLFVGSFLILILIGTILLLLPGASDGIEPLSFVDALFTSTSATCVTGLIVRETGGFFTRFGQVVIMILIQFGGLGLMTFGTFFALVFRREFGVRERMLLGDILNVNVFSKIKSLLSAIIVITLSFEAIGAILMYLNVGSYMKDGESRFFWSIFHSISAFCNAGFSIWDDNIIRFTSDWKMTFIFAGLIIFGGLGFVVLTDIGMYILSPWKRKKRKIPHFTLQTKIVFITTIILILSGMFLLMLSDTNSQLSKFKLPTTLLTAFFQSVTARTAGFNTVNIGSLAAGQLLILIILMFIGASPGSTGGGIKTTTFTTIFGLIKARMTGRKKVNLFNKSISPDIVNAAAMIIFLGLVLVSTGTFCLCVLELPNHGEWTFLDMLFEVVSAFGTVGLSTGITFNLCDASKLVLISIMFLGRVGPLTFLFAVISRKRIIHLEYVEENIIVG